MSRRLGCCFAGFLLGAAGISSLAASGAVAINELMPSNATTLADEEGDRPDWFELVSPGGAAVDLTGWGLSDNPAQPFKWRFEAATLPAGGFLVVFASGKDRQPRPVAPRPPASVAGLRVWLAADAVNPANAQQVRVTPAGRFVRRWTTLAGGGFDAVQATDAAQPELVAAAHNGRAALRFDGADDRLGLPRPAASNSFTLIAVFRPTAAHEVDSESAAGVGGVSGQRWLFGAAHGGDFNAGAGVSAGTNGVSAYEHGSGYMPALAVHAAPLGDAWTLLTTTYADRRPVLAVNGLTVRQGELSARANVTAPVEIGAGAYGEFAGDVAEVLLFGRALAEDERRGVEQWLADKHALTLPQPRHTGFNLNADGESLVLTAPDGTTVDRADFGPVPQDVSFGRQPDRAGPWVYFAAPTPGAPNVTPGAGEWLEPVTFSTPAGFYTNTVRLALAVANPGATLRYTTDGTEPTEASALYAGPVELGPRAGTPNGISMIPTAGGWQPPAGEVFKAWVVRARAFKDGALPSPTATHTFIVSARGRGRYTLPVVSLSTAPDHFFSAARGLYVPGDTGANFSQRGPEWERPVFVELFESDGSRALAQEAAVSIHGNTSQNFPIKGLDLDARGGRGREPFRHRLFPGRLRDSFENVLLRPSGHDHYMAFLRDELMQSLMADTGAETQAARPCVVFLNGEYWGLHYLKEKQDTEFVAHYAGRDRDGVDYLEGYAAPRAGDTQAWDALVRLLTDNDPASPAVLADAAARMEMASYADYKLAEIFTYRWDIGNHRFWRPREPGGRFRWLQFDNDVGWGGFWSEAPAWEFDMLQADLEATGTLHDHNNETTTFLLRRLVLNAEFRRDFVNRACDLLNSLYLPTNTIARINALAAVLEPEMAEHTARWREPASLGAWRGHVEYLRDFAVRRPEFVRGHFRRRFALGRDVIVRAAASDPRGGRLRVGSLAVTNGPAAPWTGTYFAGNPVTFRAEPASGYRFAGWEGLAGVTNNPVTLGLSADLNLTAQFAPVAIRVALERGPGGDALHVTGPADTAVVIEEAARLPEWAPGPTLLLDAAGRAVVPVVAGESARFFRVVGGAR